MKKFYVYLIHWDYATTDTVIEAQSATKAKGIYIKTQMKDLLIQGNYSKQQFFNSLRAKLYQNDY